jgi:hypothetical protein
MRKIVLVRQMVFYLQEVLRIADPLAYLLPLLPVSAFVRIGRPPADRDPMKLIQSTSAAAASTPTRGEMMILSKLQANLAPKVHAVPSVLRAVLNARSPCMPRHL